MTKTPPPTIETQVALLDQFNREVVKPFIEETRELQKSIKDSLDNLDYVSKSEHDNDMANVKQALVKLENDVRKRDWLRNTLSAILGVVLTLLVTYVITDLLNKS